MSNFKLEFILKQHTPLIHFQQDQAGATLRATEMKPKLDAYIFKRLLTSKNFKTNLPASFAFKKYMDEVSSEWANWLVGSGRSEHATLDYKITIESIEPEIRHFTIGDVVSRRGEMTWEHQFPGFFANMGKEEKEEELRFFSFSNQPIQCSIKCINPNLLEYFNQPEAHDEDVCQLQTILTDFFMTHNFGMRQSKGFGSFTLTRFKNQAVALNLEDYEFSFNVAERAIEKENEEITFFTRNKYQNAQDRTLHSDWLNLFQHINFFYRTLRSGINVPNEHNPKKALYFKSLMFHWAKARPDPEQWDKKSIRYMLFGGGNGTPKHFEYEKIEDKKYPPNGTFTYTPPNKVPKDGKYLYRDLLGLASEQEWGKYKATVKKEVKNREGNQLARFKSPLLFKPVKQNARGLWTIIIFPSPIPHEYLEASVKIAAKDRGELTLVTPQAFSVVDYLRWAIDFFNDSDLTDLVGKGQDKHPDLNKIKRIYEDLNKENHD